MPVIYLLYCKASNKSYIGQSVNSLEHRWKKHLVSARQNRMQPISCAIRKYGVDAFERSILAETNTLQKLNELERAYILKYNTKAPNGYNLTDGGEGTIGYSHSVESRRKISNAKRGKSSWNKGLHMQSPSLETRAKMSAAHRGNKYALGKKLSIERATKLHEARKAGAALRRLAKSVEQVCN